MTGCWDAKRYVKGQRVHFFGNRADSVLHIAKRICQFADFIFPVNFYGFAQIAVCKVFFTCSFENL
jgi:hypothetical protein